MERRSLSDYLFYGALAAVLVGFLFFFVVNNRDVWAEKGWWPASDAVQAPERP